MDADALLVLYNINSGSNQSMYNLFISHLYLPSSPHCTCQGIFLGKQTNNTAVNSVQWTKITSRIGLILEKIGPLSNL